MTLPEALRRRRRGRRGLVAQMEESPLHAGTTGIGFGAAARSWRSHTLHYGTEAQNSCLATAGSGRGISL